MTDIIDQAKDNMAELMRDGVTINLCYPRGDVRFTAINLLEEAIGRCDHVELSRLLTAGDFAEFGRLVHAAREAAIKETCDEEVMDWLRYQAKEEDAA